AAAVLVWRACAPTWHPVHLDLIFLATLHAVYTAFRRDGREWPVVTVALAAALFALYLQGQLPHTLAVLDLLP
ncbi:MAG TPA: hypothetical protein VEJ18_02045, partial [Planctomycetota bacterium]|nr:hypothetical protein [Planctomycetota bacterium]